MSNAAHRYEMVAAIDFLTTYSGYAYSYQHDKEKVHVNSNWSSGSSLWKVPTVILFDDKHKFLAFGEKAGNMYNEYAECEEEHKYLYFDRFKMMLYKKEGSKRGFDLIAANGKSMKAIKVFSGAIEYLKNHLITAVNGRNRGNKVRVENIRWVLTVPAIWSDSAKHFMREAAEKAGIPRRSVVIALEPECASIYCKTQPEEKKLDVDINKTGVKYMILDNGGGTVDVTVHENKTNDSVIELYKASGVAWGGTKVDRLFEDYLVSMLSKPVVEKVKRENPADWVDMMRDFEKIKRSIDDTNDFCSFMLKPCVCDVYKELMEVDLIKSFENNICARGATMRGKTRLQIPKPVIVEILQDVSDDVGKHVSSLLQIPEVKDINFIIMVGGFSNLRILSEKIKSLSGNIPVIIPEEAELSVLKGAAMFGWNPCYIMKRRCKKTYGREVNLDFDPNIDAERYKSFDSYGVAKCTKRFDTLVTVNEEIDIEHKVTSITFPLKNEQIDIAINIYGSDKEVVRYCDEPGLVKVGQLVVPLPNPDGIKANERKVSIAILFGNTEIQVEAQDVIGGKSVSAAFDFLASH